MLNDHKTVELAPHVHIDLGMVSIIKALWDLGKDTRYCCQGEPYNEELRDQAYISFGSIEEAKWFQDLIDRLNIPNYPYDNYPEAVYWYMTPEVEANILKELGAVYA